MIPEGWTRKGKTAMENRHEDVICWKWSGELLRFECHIKGGAAAFGLKSIDEALAMVAAVRG